jgi:pilus assembly protein TadC
MTLDLLAALAAAATAAAALPPAPSRTARQRLARFRPGAHGRRESGTARAQTRRGGSRGRARWAGSRSRVGASLLAGLVAGAVVGGLPGVVVGVAVVPVLGRVLTRAGTGRERRRKRAVAADAPVAADLLAACLATGMAPASAAASVAEAVGGPVGDALHGVVARLSLGAGPEDAWDVLAAEPGLGPLARACRRAVDSGAPLADVADRLADDVRSAARADAESRAQRVGVHAVAPLGVCFLPAFLLLGVVPVVVGTAARALGGAVW